MEITRGNGAMALFPVYMSDVRNVIRRFFHCLFSTFMKSTRHVLTLALSPHVGSPEMCRS